MSRFFSTDLQALSPYVPGEQPRETDIIKLNTNENPYEPGKKVYQAGEAAMKDLRRYPDPEARELVSAIAAREGVPQDRVAVGNGSDELLGFAFLAFHHPGAKVYFPEISYGFYPVFADFGRWEACPVPLGEDFSVNPRDYLGLKGTIVLANPNAPTGMCLSLKEIQEILESNPDHPVIVDEAYVDFGGVSALPLLEGYDNLLIVRTLSKSRSLAGCRVGYTLASREMTQDINRVKFSFNPYSLDRLAIAMAAASVRDEETFKKNCRKVMETREWFRGEMEARGFEVLPSQANFLFLRHPDLKGADLMQALRDRGILVRHFDKPRIRDFIRVTIGTWFEMERMLEKLDELQKSRG